MNENERKAKVKNSGWIIYVRRDMDCEGNTIWVEDLTDTKYYASELVFFSDDSMSMPNVSSENCLSYFTDDELRKELKRREKLCRFIYPPNVRCGDCKHCEYGFTYRNQTLSTTICKMKPKPAQGPDRFYTTTRSFRACEMFEPKKT